MYNRNVKHTNALNIGTVLAFITTSFLYLLTGIVILMGDILFNMGIRRDTIFIMWLFGFVSMIVFGLSYMFVSGFTRNKAFMNKTMKYEYILLNIGVITFFGGFADIVGSSISIEFAGTGLILLMIAIILHILNLAYSALSGNQNTVRARNFSDEQ